MKIAHVFFLTVTVSVFSAGQARAFCSAPSMYETPPHTPSSMSRPDAPYCLSGFSYTREHSCDQWEIDAYVREIEDYTNELRRFAQEAADFAEEAGSFANDAVQYAICERDEVMSEIE